MIRRIAIASGLGLALAFGLPEDGRADKGIPWETDPIGAFARAEQTLRPVFILFTGDPCGEKAPIGYGDVEAGSGRAGNLTSRGSGAKTHQTDCELLELDVLSKPELVSAADRFVPFLFNRSGRQMAGGGAVDDDISRRYQVRTIPTLLIADPWGNEILRLVGRTPKDRVIQILAAVPADFVPLRTAGEQLKGDSEALPALLSAAAFYESNKLGAIAERYYERAAATPGARDDVAKRRQVVLARGFNLLKSGRAKDAVNVYQSEAKREPEAPQMDAVLFGWALASLTSGDRATAKKLLEDLSTRFPSSAYTARLREHLASEK